MFKKVKPMLAGGLSEDKINSIWDNNEWICEEKLDGSRYILQYDEDGNPRLTSRRDSVKTNSPVDKTENLRNYVCLSSTFKNTIIDGEIIGGKSFAETVSLMGSLPEKAQEMLNNGFELRYVVYDILEYNGIDIRSYDFHHRRQCLKEFVKYSNNKYIELVRELPNEKLSFEKILKEGGEGVILKRKSGKYSEGKRNTDWVKVKRIDTFDGVIVGEKIGTGKYSNTLGALIVAQYIDGNLTEVATVSGMTDEQRNYFHENIESLKFTVVEFEAQEKTKARYRHPRFVRLRPDKTKEECIF